MKQTKTLHIVAFDIPFPANYGGVIDIYYKIKALHEKDVHVILHCFEYGRKPVKELQSICKKVYYYPRKTFKNFLIGNVPYIVASRESSELLNNLCKDNHPILFEGLHSTYYIKNTSLKNRFKIVRTHNVEHDYYHHLEMVEKNFFKRYFFKLETEKLKKYQSVLKYADLICAISPNDEAYFQKKFGKTIFIPAFHANQSVVCKSGKGDFILYHGNLAIGENHEAAMYLIQNVFSKLSLPCIIAGSHPKKELRQMASAYENVSLIDHGNTEELNTLIANAHLNILYTQQDTGIKLKLLNALFKGRFCIVNHKMVDHTGLEPLCAIANNAEDFLTLIKSFWKQSFEKTQIGERIHFFENHFNVQSIAEDLVQAINFESEKIEKREKPSVKTHPTTIKKVKITLNSLFGLLPL